MRTASTKAKTLAKTSPSTSDPGLELKVLGAGVGEGWMRSRRGVEQKNLKTMGMTDVQVAAKEVEESTDTDGNEHQRGLVQAPPGSEARLASREGFAVSVRMRYQLIAHELGSDNFWHTMPRSLRAYRGGEGEKGGAGHGWNLNLISRSPCRGLPGTFHEHWTDTLFPAKVGFDCPIQYYPLTLRVNEMQRLVRQFFVLPLVAPTGQTDAFSMALEHTATQNTWRPHVSCQDA